MERKDKKKASSPAKQTQRKKAPTQKKNDSPKKSLVKKKVVAKAAAKKAVKAPTKVVAQESTPASVKAPTKEVIQESAPAPVKVPTKEVIQESAPAPVKAPAKVVVQEPAKLQKDRTDKKVLTLSIQNVYKRFGKKHAVNGVSFDLHTGEVVGFLGPNGAGKTTMFYMIVGFLAPDSGNIFFDGKNIGNIPMYKRARLGISYLPQEPSVFRRLSVEKNIIAVLQTIPGLNHREKKDRLEKLIKEFGLSEFRKQKAYTLSGGERRRTEIARGMALYPHFLLLDEPFTGIDPKARFELKQIIAALSTQGVGVLITDHNERDTLSITDRAFILHEGDIVASGSRKEIMSDVKAREIYLGDDYEH